MRKLKPIGRGLGDPTQTQTQTGDLLGDLLEEIAVTCGDAVLLKKVNSMDQSAVDWNFVLASEERPVERTKQSSSKQSV